MSSTARYFFVFFFILVSVLGFAGEVSAVHLKDPEYATLFYREGKDVIVWNICNDYRFWTYVGYYLDINEPVIDTVRLAEVNGSVDAYNMMGGIIFGPGVAHSQQLYCPGAMEINLGKLSAGWHRLAGFTWTGHPAGEGIKLLAYYYGYFEVCVKEVFDSCTAESLPNTCGQTASRTGVVNCNGSCSVYAPSTPSNPSYYQGSCQLTSVANVCGQTATAGGSYDCDRNCVGTPPPAPPITVPPTTPSSVPAWNEDGYRIDATSAACNDTDVTQYFEFSRDGVNWTGDNPGFRPNSWATLP